MQKSIEAYVANNTEFELFKRRRERAAAVWRIDNYTIFDCLREDFLSRSRQEQLLGPGALAHQNAWDFDSLCRSLVESGFRSENVFHVNFQQTKCADFAFEGTYPSEANESYRSLYVEALK